jgi:glycosyltransferase involved in cell wall biosynthesis
MISILPRILQVTVGLDEKLGGPPEVTYDIAEYLKRKSSLLIIIGAVSRSYSQRLQSDGITFSRIKSFTQNSYGAMTFGGILKYRRMLREAEIVFHHGFYLWSLLITLLLARKKSKCFVMPHGSLDPYGQTKNRIPKRLFRSIFRLLQRRRLHIQIITATEIEAKRVMTVLNNVDIKSIGLGIPMPVCIKKREESPSFFFTLSRITQVKRLDLVIEAIGELEIENALPLRIYGTGEEELERELELLVDRKKLSELVSFEGSVREDAKSQLLNSNGILLVTSENENFSRVVAEAIVHGIPVVVSRGTALSDFVQTYECGEVIEDLEPASIADTMKNVMSRYEEFSGNCLRYRYLLDIERTFENMERLLNQI